MKKIIQYKGYEILHRHEFNRVYFSAWQGDIPIKFDGEIRHEIQADNRFLNWNNPLTIDDMEWLISPMFNKQEV